MIHGIGVDIVHVPEFAAALKEPGTTFFQRYFSRVECDYCEFAPYDQRAYRYAVRYAAKEACLKALDGARIHSPAAFRFEYPEASVCKDEYGRPYFQFHGRLADYVSALQLQSRLSLSHTGDYAIAQVSMECVV
ncbi:MAG TPA: 4-phosphopantetheinyl transferase [Leptospiraceae bacterium]|nr:4-phosphopantetheinyl transferase [Spirochaetaceae bacterium]HBS03483.1 4-phosphopantetheinyl transferase [Leptospiraceae bacterium]|tara:strand:+ start:84563 stop:84964 length:402 start_codon:yes stop_codon:yes gene_type:complete